MENGLPIRGNGLRFRPRQNINWWSGCRRIRLNEEFAGPLPVVSISEDLEGQSRLVVSETGSNTERIRLLRVQFPFELPNGLVEMKAEESPAGGPAGTAPAAGDQISGVP
ncbi:MAG: hypothetical protein QM713_17670 [Arachnia sp.]